jgi:hypothetical protein
LGNDTQNGEERGRRSSETVERGESNKDRQGTDDSARGIRGDNEEVAEVTEEQNPFAISKLTDKNDAYRIYTPLQTENGEFIVVGVDVKSVGREIEVNAISIVFGRRNNANLPQNEDVIYKSKEITLEQSAFLERPNFVQYPIIQEFSNSKDTTNSKKVNSLEQENTNATKIKMQNYIKRNHHLKPRPFKKNINQLSFQVMTLQRYYNILYYQRKFFINLSLIRRKNPMLNCKMSKVKHHRRAAIPLSVIQIILYPQ